jgi:hypothetical protein
VAVEVLFRFAEGPTVEGSFRFVDCDTIGTQSKRAISDTWWWCGVVWVVMDVGGLFKFGAIRYFFLSAAGSPISQGLSTPTQ